MNKPNFEDSFSVEDIHELREFNYEETKEISPKELIKKINTRANKFKKKSLKDKKERIIIY